ncbi:MAG: D-alanine--D-alanine ligase [Gemmatimonadota bacterium]|nr:D-alanine--D-alanine ligase [Gemmatimonadota bacterium]
MSETGKRRVVVLFGGESPEHEVSLQSARNVIDAIDTDKWDVSLIGIDRAGRWHTADASRFLLDSGDPRRIRLETGDRDVTLVPGARSEIVALDRGEPLPPVDVVFPVLHGPLGEDGTVQGLLRLAHLPFVGPGVLGSAVGMDKDVAKRLLRDAGIPIAPFITVRGRALAPPWDDVVAGLGSPVFVKPANMGSSVGVARVSDAAEYLGALDDAFSYDSKVLLERAIRGREIECAVLGNETPEASVPGEIVPRHAFYSYEAKYLDEDGAELSVPADLDPETTARVRDLAVRTFRTLCCEGMARVDFFLTPDGELVVNEINTIPGFTRISMYPKLWAASGVGYSELIDRLLQLAIDRGEREARLASALDLLSGAEAHGEAGAEA